MRFDRPAAARRRVIGLTPLIDVVFILLLFFMLATNFQRWRALTVNAPAPGATAGARADGLRLRVSAGGGLTLGGQTLAGGLDELRSRLAHEPGLSVVVDPDPDVALQTLVSVFDALAADGVRRVSLGGR